jgi:hypothetical protein
MKCSFCGGIATGIVRVAPWIPDEQKPEDFEEKPCCRDCFDSKEWCDCKK